MRTLIRIVLAYLLVILFLYVINTPVSASTYCPVYGNRTMTNAVHNAAGQTLFRISQHVTYKLDCNFNFAYDPVFTRDYWMNNCVTCFWRFDHWISPDIVKGDSPWPHVRRTQRAEFSLCLIPLPCRYVIYGVWQRVTAVPPAYGSEYGEGLVDG